MRPRESRALREVARPSHLGLSLFGMSIVLASSCFSEPWPPPSGDSVFQGLLLHFPETAVKGVVFEKGRTELHALFVSLSTNATIAGIDVRADADAKRALRLVPFDELDYSIAPELIPPDFYKPGGRYVFSASVAGDLYEATIRAPAWTDNLDFDPDEAAVSEAYPTMKKHPRAEELRLRWPQELGERALVSVVRGVVSSTLTPQIVYHEPGYMLGPTFSQVAGQAPRTTLEIPGSVFAEDGPYVVTVTTFESQPEAARSGTSWSLVVGHASSVTLAVGGYVP